MHHAKRSYLTIGMLLLFAATLVACGGGGSDNPPVSPTTQSKLQGSWEKRGYGRAIEVSGGTVTEYDFTSQTCVRAGSEELGDLASKLEAIEDDNTVFTLRDAPVGFVIRYHKVTALPAVCNSPIGASPTEIFDHVWNTFNEYYAFFEERGVDWLAQYDAVRDRIHDGMSDAELFDALSALVEPIDDVHVSINLPDGTTFSPGQPKGFYQDFLAEFDAQSEITDPQEYFNQELNTVLAIIDSVYLDGEYVTAGGSSNDFFKWGFIGDEVGYLSIGAFILGFDQTIADQLVEIEDVIDQALTDLNGTQALIIDVRLSPGGADPIALAIADRFADMERLAIRKLTRTVDGEGTAHDVFVAPSTRVRYTNPVIVVTSGFSASATEAFTLAMRALPQVTLVGEPTIGALSDVLGKPLPNGWNVYLANEVYYGADGLAYEAVGIPPHVEVSAFAMPEREAGQDSGLNAALAELGIDIADL